MLQHHQLRKIVKKTSGEGSLNYLSISKEEPKLPDGKRSYEEPLSPVACLTTGRLYHSYVLSIVGFKKDIDVVSLKSSLQNTVAQHQRFSSILIRDGHNNLKWSLREVEINDHVIVPFLDPSFTQNPGFVNEYTASLATAPPLNPSRPLWEVHVLNAKSEEAAGSLVFRIHHSLGDCVSLMSLLVNSTRKASDPKCLPTIPERNKSRDKQISSTLLTVYGWLAAFWFTLLAALDNAATVLWKRDVNPLREDATKTAFCNSKRLAHVTLDMVDILSIKKAVNGSLNDVIMGAISAGLVRYLSRRNATLPAKTAINSDGIPEVEYCLPSNLSARALVAVNTRRSPVLKDLASNMKNPKQAMWGNKVGFWLFPLPMVHYEDPLDYCRATTSTSTIKKLSFESSFTFAFSTSMGTKFVEYIADKLNTSTTLWFSNVVGPAEEIEFCDNHVTHIIPTTYLNHCSIMMHFITYGGKGKLIALVSEDVVPDPQQLCSDCADALQQMKKATDT